MYNDVLVSIIIPVYNIEPYIRRCIDSVRKQTHSKLEIILVADDGSTDRSAAICDQLAKEDERIIVIHQEHCGLGMARNAALDVALGEWLCFIDGDDFVSKRFVEMLLHAALDHDCLTAQCKFRRGTADSIDESISEPEVKVMDWRSFLFLCSTDYEHSGFGVWLNIYHRSIFSDIRFPSLRYAEDAAIIARIYYTAREKRIAAVDGTLYYYFQRSDSLTQRKTTLSVLDHYLAMKQLILFWEEKKETDLYDIYWNEHFRILIDVYLNLSRDLPQMEGEYRHLRDEILTNSGKAKRMCHYVLTTPPGASGIWASLLDPDKPVVMYGYGEIGRKRALPWIRYYQLPIVEIWDRQAAENGTVDGIPYCPAHSGMSRDITIIIAIEDPYVTLTVQNKLRRMGYRNFVHWPAFNAALKYANYKKFLPFLLDGK